VIYPGIGIGHMRVLDREWAMALSVVMEKPNEIAIGNLSIGYQESTLESQNRLRWNFLMGMLYGAFFSSGFYCNLSAT
jgi:hypothetical protein